MICLEEKINSFYWVDLSIIILSRERIAFCSGLRLGLEKQARGILSNLLDDIRQKVLIHLSF